MKRAVKEQWLRDLRRGEYEQGTGMLRRGGQFCCLGVLADQLVKTGLAEWDEWGVDRHGNQEYDLRTTDRQSVSVGVLDRAAQSLVGWPWAVLQGTLSKMNDEAGATFSEIADWVEANIPADED